jgi:hypothetical protein
MINYSCSGENEFIQQFSLKYYIDFEEMLKKLKLKIKQFYLEKELLGSMSNVLYFQNDVQEIIEGDIVNPWEDSFIFKIDFRDYENSTDMIDTLTVTLNFFFNDKELRKKNLVIQLVHHILPF